MPLNQNEISDDLVRALYEIHCNIPPILQNHYEVLGNMCKILHTTLPNLYREVGEIYFKSTCPRCCVKCQYLKFPLCNRETYRGEMPGFGDCTFLCLLSFPLKTDRNKKRLRKNRSLITFIDTLFIFDLGG